MSTRRGYTSGLYSGRRPRTKVYDCNYSMGEGYYRSALDNLDRKQFGKVLTPSAAEPEPVITRDEPVREPRPKSMIDFDSTWTEPARIAEESSDDLISRIRAARQAAQSLVTNEQSLDSVLSLRSEETKRRFAEKMLDSVGLNGDVEVRPSRRLVKMEDPKWPATPEEGESVSEMAARARARATRARLADLECEMNDLNERSVARERRAAALRQMLAEESDSVKLSSKKITITEKKTTATY